MSTPASLPPDVVLRNHFRAKDENRPHLLDDVFTVDAVLEIRNATSTIAFPAVTSGRDAIADVLVRSFGQTDEDVNGLYLRPCMCRALTANAEAVGQSARGGGANPSLTPRRAACTDRSAA